MSNFIYDKAREAFLSGGINWLADTIKVQLVDLGAYSPSQSADQYLADIPGGARIGTAATLASKTATAGVADAADVSFTGLSGAPTLEALAIYKDTGTPSTSPLIGLIDSATGLPVGAGATQVDVAWSNASNKIFKL